MTDTEKVERAVELAREATRRTNEAVADAKAIRTELRHDIDEIKALLTRLEGLHSALGEALGKSL